MKNLLYSASILFFCLFLGCKEPRAGKAAKSDAEKPGTEVGTLPSDTGQSIGNPPTQPRDTVGGNPVYGTGHESPNQRELDSIKAAKLKEKQGGK